MTPAELRARVADVIERCDTDIEFLRKRMSDDRHGQMHNRMQGRISGIASVSTGLRLLLSEYDASARGDRT